MARHRQTNEEWINECLVIEDQRGICSSFSLEHITGGSINGKEIDNVIITSAKPWKPSELALRFDGKARSFAQDLPGVQQFILKAYYCLTEESEPIEKAYHPFTINGATDYEGLGTESPDSKGLTQQAMRHMENVYTTSVSQQSMLFLQTQQIMSMMSGQLSEYRTENAEAWRIVKEVGMTMVAQQNKQQLDALQFQRLSDERKLIMSMIPGLIKQVTGIDIVPPETIDSNLMDMFAESIDEETIQFLSKKLKPEVKGMLESRMADILEKKTAERKRLQERIKNVDPELEAGGEPSLKLLEGGK